MDLIKNNIYQIEIEDIGNDGSGIGHIDGMAVFVKDTAIGDVANVRITKVTKKLAYGHLEEMLVPSPYRVEPVCAHAKRCGGCTLQHIAYEKQLEYKWHKVYGCLKRIGRVDNLEEIMETPVYGMEYPYHYRNKAQFPVGRDRDGNVIIGFYATRSHDIIDSDVCPIGDSINDKIIPVIKRFITEKNISTYDETTGAGLVRHVLIRVGKTTGEVMVCLVLNGHELPFADYLTNELRKLSDDERRIVSICLNINMDNTNRILGDTCVTLWGQDYITDCIGNVRYEISPLSFYQVNPTQTRALYDKVLEYADLNGNEIVWDMYCGIGTISLFLAKSAKQVYGVEIVPDAIEDARRNAEINGISNVDFFVGKAEEVVPDIYSKGGDGAYADVVVVDPPRKGCDAALLSTLVAMSPKRIVYVSCDPATLARDICILSRDGYELENAAVVDQFCQSTHCESVALVVRAVE